MLTTVLLTVCFSQHGGVLLALFITLSTDAG
jgi:hypothetical protein